ncbi:Arm DNA-binding domain-containing protein [Brevundimonas sp. BT-123]|uniref:Arm DNA-binding domain-containing protein n=1 Tax=Brevundimonas sp. BT-123 TaxID=2986928 RepID=UPI0022363979|nr:Arm DNA-binding domain-containing protein [Brevundimonas sp. BT-123]MCW0047571.1 Arm DNA-binding domain-containing protein [Brevundimonas sp. BT-123]
MPKIRFSASSLEHALAQDASGASTKVVWDTETRGLGFYANRQRSGSFFVQFRVGGRQRKVTLGRLNELTVPEARKAANEIMVAARQGRDVIREQRQTHVATLTLGAAFEEYHAALKRRAVSPRTLTHNEGVWRRTLSKHAGRELGSLNKREVRSWHTGWGDRGPTAANHAGRLLRTVYNYASKRLDDLPPNPCVAIEWFPEREQRDVIAPNDLPEWWEKAASLDNPIDVTP